MCMGGGVSGCEEGVGHLEALHKCVVEVPLGSVWVDSGQGGHMEGSGGLYQDGGSPPKGQVVVFSDFCSKAGWADNVSGRF